MIESEVQGGKEPIRMEVLGPDDLPDPRVPVCESADVSINECCERDEEYWQVRVLNPPQVGISYQVGTYKLVGAYFHVYVDDSGALVMTKRDGARIIIPSGQWLAAVKEGDKPKTEATTEQDPEDTLEKVAENTACRAQRTFYGGRHA